MPFVIVAVAHIVCIVVEVDLIALHMRPELYNEYNIYFARFIEMWLITNQESRISLI